MAIAVRKSLCLPSRMALKVDRQCMHYQMKNKIDTEGKRGVKDIKSRCHVGKCTDMGEGHGSLNRWSEKALTVASGKRKGARGKAGVRA